MGLVEETDVPGRECAEQKVQPDKFFTTGVPRVTSLFAGPGRPRAKKVRPDTCMGGLLPTNLVDDVQLCKELYRNFVLYLLVSLANERLLAADDP